MRASINSLVHEEAVKNFAEHKNEKIGCDILVPPQVGMLGYEKHPREGKNMRVVGMSASEVAAIKTSEGSQEFATYYTCSLKDMGNCNVVAMFLGLPLWELSAQLELVKDLLTEPINKDAILPAVQSVGELLKMVTNEVTMENAGNVLIAK